MILNLVAGTCIMFEGLIWQVEFSLQDYAKLSYPIIARMENKGKIAEEIEMRGHLFEISRINKTKKLVKCPKNFKKGN